MPVRVFRACLQRSYVLVVLGIGIATRASEERIGSNSLLLLRKMLPSVFEDFLPPLLCRSCSIPLKQLLHGDVETTSQTTSSANRPS